MQVHSIIACCIAVVILRMLRWKATWLSNIFSFWEQMATPPSFSPMPRPAFHLAPFSEQRHVCTRRPAHASEDQSIRTLFDQVDYALVTWLEIWHRNKPHKCQRQEWERVCADEKGGLGFQQKKLGCNFIPTPHNVMWSWKKEISIFFLFFSLTRQIGLISTDAHSLARSSPQCTHNYKLGTIIIAFGVTIFPQNVLSFLL